jgi:IS30 family transposase
MTFKAIGKLIGKDATTVSKEVKLHAQQHINSFTKTNEICCKLLKAPFVCNGCNLKSSAACRYARRVYVAKIAQSAYEKTLVESREGIALNKSEFYENDRIITERMKAGQHLYHIIHSSNVTASKSTIYRYFHQGYLSASVLDLPRVVKFKPRDKKTAEYVPKGVKIGRSYEDFLLYMEENSLTEHQEIDTVIGTQGGKVIMTIHFTAVNFMFGILLENKTAAEAATKIIQLKRKLSDNALSFGQLFPSILADNGGEFADVATFENDLNGNPETKFFFCDPMQSSQKPFIEKNHTLFRDIIPKGTSFDSFTQNTVNLIFSHVNSI